MIENSCSSLPPSASFFLGSNVQAMKKGPEIVARQGPPPMGPPPPAAYLEENDGPKMLAVVGTFYGLATLTVLLRVYVRAFMRKNFGVDGMFPRNRMRESH